MKKEEIEKLYEQLLAYWNQQDASGFASLFTPHSNIVGFDGSQMTGPTQIEQELTEIFGNHQTANYVWKILEVRELSSTIVLLRSIVGMIPPGQSEINPSLNAIQSMIASKETGSWKIEFFQNTAAQFHGRPGLVTQMTQELKAAHH